MANASVVQKIPNIAYGEDKLANTRRTSFTGYGWPSPPRAWGATALKEDTL